MDRATLVKLLATAKGQLAQTEARIRRLLGAMTTPGEFLDLSEATRVLEALQQRRIERVLEVQGIQDELAAHLENRG
jgi:alpha-D-ribose 1-methylphosphonate 5-triphosphate synthase subunit PhnH